MRTKLHNKRIERDKTQGDIAKFSQISLKSYQRIEHGKQRPNVDTAILIAEALNSTVEELFKEL